MLYVVVKHPIPTGELGDHVRKYGDYSITLIEGNLLSVSSEVLKKANNNYSGAHLILSNISKVHTSMSN